MKLGFFITARLKSTRLKRKILLDLNGKSILDRIIERCKATKGVDEVVLCTSSNPQDSELFDYALKHGIKFYHGSEEDVLKRLLEAAKYYGFDAFLSITADNPLFSMYSSSLLVEAYKKSSFDFGFTLGLPVGLATSLIDRKALDVVVHMKKVSDTEIWGPFLNRSDFFHIFNLIITNHSMTEEKRLTVDYPEDYELLKKIYRNFDTDAIPSVKDVLSLLREYPELWNVNMTRKQRWPSEEEIRTINTQFDEAVTSGKKYASQIDKEFIPGSTELKIEI